MSVWFGQYPFGRFISIAGGVTVNRVLMSGRAAWTGRLFYTRFIHPDSIRHLPDAALLPVRGPNQDEPD